MGLMSMGLNSIGFNSMGLYSMGLHRQFMWCLCRGSLTHFSSHLHQCIPFSPNISVKGSLNEFLIENNSMLHLSINEKQGG